MTAEAASKCEFRPTHYLRIEAVNFRTFVEDTQDISAVRGGSLLLLGSTRKVENLLKGLPVDFRVVSNEASVGIFSILIEEKDGQPADNRAGKLRAQVERELGVDSKLGHGTFVVDIVARNAGEDFGIVREMLSAANRFRQLGGPSLVPPAWNEERNETRPVCAEDRVRPSGRERNPKGELVSPLTHLRREEGRKAKRSLHHELAGLDDFEGAFTRTLEELCQKAPTGAAHLEAKIALLYVDGNGFGSILRSLAREEQSHTAFSRMVADARTGYVRRLLRHMMEAETRWPNAWRNPMEAVEEGERTSEKRWRLETLLWGGDELVQVVPAWQGWNLLALFFEAVRDLSFRGQALSFAAALVFAKQKAPIHRLNALARTLADEVKRKSRSEACFAVEVLESFDHLGTDLATARDRQGLGWLRNPASEGARFPDLVCRALDVPTIAKAVSALKRPELAMPRSRIFSLAQELVTGRPADGNPIDFKRLGFTKEQKPHLEDLEAAFGPKALWLQLSMLWDYITPGPSTPS